MDNDAFRRTYREINERDCAYEKGILTNQCGCSQAQRFCIAEREGVRCASDEAQRTCIALLDLLSEQARFALKSGGPGKALPHAKAMRLQVGGLRGVAAALEPDAPSPGYVEDVHATLRAAIVRFGSLQRLPFGRIIREIAAYTPRRRRRRP